jgi:hypothetical protein
VSARWGAKAMTRMGYGMSDWGMGTGLELLV